MISPDADSIYAAARKCVMQLLLLFSPPFALCLSYSLAAGVNDLFVAGLCITHLDEAYVGQLLYAPVVYLQGNDVMLAVGNGKRLTEVLVVNEVTQDKTSAASLDGLCKILQGGTYVSTLALGLELQKFAYDIEDVLAAFLGRNELFHLVREEDHTYLVVILYCTEGKSGSNLCKHLTFHLGESTKLERSADIHEKHDGELAFFLENLDVRFAKTCRDIPFNIAYVIAVLVLAHLGKSHTTTLERRMVFAGKDVGRESAGLDLNPAYLL